MTSRLSVKQCQICYWQYRGGYCPYCKCVKLEHQITDLRDALDLAHEWLENEVQEPYFETLSEKGMKAYEAVSEALAR